MLDLLFTRSRVPRDLGSVTTVDREAEVAPRAAGLSRAAVERIWSRAERLYSTGIHPALALCLRRQGEVVIDRAIGHASGNGPADAAAGEKRLATPATPFNIFSGSKAVTAMVAHLLDQKGLLHVGDPVCEYIPEYARHGKHHITIAHLLNHRAGVPNLPPEALDLDRLGDESFVIDTLCDAKPLWRPGRLLGYHAITGGFLIGEITKRVTGKNIRDFLADEILNPLGFRWMNYGVAPQDVDQVALNYFTGPPVLPPLSNLMERALGKPFHDVIRLTNDPRFLTGIVPAGNVVTTANELSRFYQLLVNGGELDGHRIFEPRTVGRAVAEQSYLEFDFTLMLPMRYGAGFMLGAEQLSLYGPDTENAFGHLGFTNVIGWADPDRGLSGALLTSGKPLLYPQLYYLWDLMRTIAAECPKLPAPLAPRLRARRPPAKTRAKRKADRPPGGSKGRRKKRRKGKT